MDRTSAQLSGIRGAAGKFTSGLPDSAAFHGYPDIADGSGTDSFNDPVPGEEGGRKQSAAVFVYLLLPCVLDVGAVCTFRPRIYQIYRDDFCGCILVDRYEFY